ncbi:coiled-coil domain-containing protein [Halosimplex salinum]|uniref:hypothetical protein n=1 Tax=Halosimplex salinum TaxID=1710538 RepID=UPI0019CFC9AA|nr:hypothetical protein [Halosimplex salinum]
MSDTGYDTDGSETGQNTDGTGRAGTDAAPLDGLALDEAAERVLARETGRDAETARASLSYAAENGVVSEAALGDALAEASKLVATAETRAELARIALDEAREAAASVEDVPTVAARIERFEHDVSAVEERAADLGPSLQSVVDDRGEPAARFAVADGVRRVEQRARSVQRDADDCQFDIEAFERWLDSHGTRVRELDEDADAFASSLDDLAAAVEAVEDAETDADPARVWFDATLRHRVAGLTVADMRAELADLRTWADREGAGPADPSLDDLADRLGDLDARREALGERLAERAEPAWRSRFGDTLADLEGELDGLAPPVDWGAVGEALEECRSTAGLDG